MHVCTLKDDDNVLWSLPEDASIWEKAKRLFRQRTLVSKNNPRCRDYFKSSAAVAYERKRHIKSNLLHIIHPLSDFRMYWELLMVVVLFLALIFNPIDATYTFRPINSSFRGLDNWADFVLDLTCIVDIVITFFTGYTIEETKEIVLDPGKIVRHYVTSLFIMDLLSSLPTSVILLIYSLLGGGESGLPFVRLLSIFKIARLRTFLLYLDQAAEAFNTNEYARKVIRYISLTFLLTHWVACVHYFVPNIIYYIAGKDISEDSWIAQAGLLEEENDWILHGHCVFRAACFLLCTHHAIYNVETDEDAIVGILSYLIGFLYILYMIVIILQMLMSMSTSETKYQAIINQLQQYMKHKQLPISMQKRLISYYEYRFQKAYFRETVITQTVSEKLRIEVNVHCCRRLVDSVSIFKDLPPHIVADVVSKLKAEVFLPNDIIVRAGTVGDSMYFLAYGTVSVETPTRKEVCHLQDGAYFGEISLVVQDQKRVANVIAIEICEVYRLDRHSFQMCFSACPDIYRKISRLAEERLENTVLLEEIQKKYLNQEAQELVSKHRKPTDADSDD